MLSDVEIRVIKESLELNLKESKKLIKDDDKNGILTVLNRHGVEEKIRIINNLLKNI